MRKILFSVFEKSADYYAARLIPFLRGGFSFSGYGGPEMKILVPKIRDTIERASMMGLTDLIGRIPFFFNVWSRLKKGIDEADILLLIDFSGLNLRLLDQASKSGKSTVYFIPPKFWAWCPERAERLKKCSLVFPLFPFEHEQLLNLGVNSFYFGHPLSEELQKIPLKKHVRGRIGIFPGSRPAEIEGTLPVMLKSLEGSNGECCMFLADDSPAFKNRIRKIVSGFKLPVNLIPPAEKYEWMSSLDRAIACSGTVVLELSYFEVPTVVVYRTSWLSYLYFKRKVILSHYSLPNILAGKEIYPELIQEDFRPDYLRQTLLELPEQDEISGDCRKLWQSLAGPDIYRRIADKINEVSA
ncbi:MAG: hypothetical protein PHW04_06130 [Candidatus Wallbacteria bacterium]|nr:hypothetical protein [Candidatus Wallbacteria bacterium]